jgi:hypothetical protein
MSQADRDLFAPVVPVDKLDRMFRDIALQPGHEAAQALINAIFANFRDIDRNFVREFQTAGFSARVFELALFAYTEEQCLDLDRTAAAPDFVLRGQHPVAIEVTTTNPRRAQHPTTARHRAWFRLTCLSPTASSSSRSARPSGASSCTAMPTATPTGRNPTSRTCHS